MTQCGFVIILQRSWFAYSPEPAGKHPSNTFAPSGHPGRRMRSQVAPTGCSSAERRWCTGQRSCVLAHARENSNDVWGASAAKCDGRRSPSESGELYAIEDEIRGYQSQSVFSHRQQREAKRYRRRCMNGCRRRNGTPVEKSRLAKRSAMY